MSAASPLGRFLPNPKLKLREQLAEVCRFRHMSHRTADAYWHWMKGFILFHGKRHPREMGAAEVQTYLSHLAVQKDVAVATQRQALNAIVFLYRDVLNVELGLIGEIEKPQRPVKLPTVLTKDEVRRAQSVGWVSVGKKELGDRRSSGFAEESREGFEGFEGTIARFASSARPSL